MPKPTKCSNPDCQYHENAPKNFCVKCGYFKTKWNYQPVPRYRCKACGKKLSSHTERDTNGQHRPDLNAKIEQMHQMGISERKIAAILGCDRKTVARKIGELDESGGNKAA